MTFDYTTANSRDSPYLMSSLAAKLQSKTHLTTYQSMKEKNYQTPGFTTYKTVFPSIVRCTILKVERGLSKVTQLSTEPNGSCVKEKEEHTVTLS